MANTDYNKAAEDRAWIDACYATDEAERRQAEYERIERSKDGLTQDWRGIQADWRKS